MEDVKISISLKNSGNLLANATLSIRTKLGNIVIKGLPIWKSSIFNDRLQENINITTPTARSHGRYVPLVFFEDRRAWFEIERLIYSAYLSKKNGSGDEEKVNPEDIPF